MRKVLSIALFLVMATMSHQALALVVTPTNSGLDLVNGILGAGITSVSGISYSGANNAASGTFTGGGNIGFDTGILLTTGYAAGAVGPNNSGSYTGPGKSTSLEFDFESTAGKLFFNYVFASEEYNEYVGSGYNDTFNLLVDGTNIALVPGTSTPIKINNVNLSSNSAYYRNNSPGPYNTQYDGLTTVLTAEALGLSSGTHHMKFLIADVGDSAFDSAVFIQGGTFSDKPPGETPIPEPGTMILLGSGLAGLASYGRKWFKK